MEPKTTLYRTVDLGLVSCKNTLQRMVSHRGDKCIVCIVSQCNKQQQNLTRVFPL